MSYLRYVFLLVMITSCGSLSDAYVHQRLAEERLTVTSIKELAADKKVAFVESPDERGCVYLWGEDNNTGFSRFTNVDPIDPQAPTLVYDAFNIGIVVRTQLVCIIIQDPLLQQKVALIEVTYPSRTSRKAVESGDSEYLLEIPADENDWQLQQVTFFDANGIILHQQVGETR